MECSLLSVKSARVVSMALCCSVIGHDTYKGPTLCADVVFSIFFKFLLEKNIFFNLKILNTFLIRTFYSLFETTFFFHNTKLYFCSFLSPRCIHFGHLHLFLFYVISNHEYQNKCNSLFMFYKSKSLDHYSL